MISRCFISLSLGCRRAFYLLDLVKRYTAKSADTLAYRLLDQEQRHACSVTHYLVIIHRAHIFSVKGERDGKKNKAEKSHERCLFHLVSAHEVIRDKGYNRARAKNRKSYLCLVIGRAKLYLQLVYHFGLSPPESLYSLNVL